MKVRKAVIPAAGLGTRLLPATKAVPKEMLPILDKPAIQYIVEEAVEAGIEEILIITNRGKDAIENHFDISYELEKHLEEKNNQEMLEMLKPISKMAKIYFIRQQSPNGLGHAVGMAKEFIKDEPFAVLLGDDLFYHEEQNCLKSLIDIYDREKKSVFALMQVPLADVSKYGIISGNKVEENLYNVKGLIEKPSPMEAPTNLAVIGRYVFTSKIFEMIEETKPGKGGEIQLTDAMYKLLAFQGMYGYIFDGKRYDTGNLLGYLKTIVDYALRREDISESFKEFLKEKI
ncbi:MAG: UTP--glucose-1-phosphate uridylyltransferase [Fusobacteria bacterium]|nr:MAG: UTP--glucose-1-phosphate uridylyltransferase [Fusobacteriota bacterium]KAF0229868.1 MAG: UTP--glucose-1-phosphate [Fusobacteriota bacterium]